MSTATDAPQTKIPTLAWVLGALIVAMALVIGFLAGRLTAPGPTAAPVR